MTSIPRNASPASAERPVVCTPVTAKQIEALKAARDGRGSLAPVPAHLAVAVSGLASADLLEIDVVGFRLTAAGVLLLAQIEEREAGESGPRPPPEPQPPREPPDDAKSESPDPRSPTAHFPAGSASGADESSAASPSTNA